MPRKKVTPEIMGEMKKLREKGLTYREIADKLNLSRWTVLKYLREGGYFKKMKGKMGLG